MPNNVTTRIKLSGDMDMMMSMLNSIKYTDKDIGSVDFNKIIPMPEKIFKGSLGKKEYELYGNDNWYFWSLENWGTKWNSYNEVPLTHEGESLIVRFDTAWSYPDPVILELSKQHPMLNFEVKYADEDFGYNADFVEYEGGEEVFRGMYAGGSHRAVLLAAEVFDMEPEYCGYVYDEKAGEYRYLPDSENENE